ncbi:MAG: PAS domain S-box protein [Planctomycetota bacterium]|nr:MAG: PAS domain S-box protein [Planctomycetota bacterium]REJ93536.1 MAG: PAS domain S-box protein [Planctomycetota bacterium]
MPEYEARGGLREWDPLTAFSENLPMPADTSNFACPSTVESLLHTIDALVLVMEPDGTIAEVNRTCEKLSGFGADELCGRNVASALLTQDSHVEFMQNVRRVTNGETIDRFDGSLLTKRGDSSRIRWTGLPLPVAEFENDTPSVLLCGIDVTTEHRALVELEEARTINTELRQEVEQLKTVVEESAEQPRQERRSDRRRHYPFEQALAPLVDRRMPAESDFFRVKFYNLGARGFSYLNRTAPAHRDVVVSLGSEDMQLMLTAQVKHVTDRNTVEGKTLLIGCEFTGRMATNSRDEK